MTEFALVLGALPDTVFRNLLGRTATQRLHFSLIHSGVQFRFASPPVEACFRLEEDDSLMSAEEARKLIAEGLDKLQQGLNKLCEAVNDLENPDEPAQGSLAAQIKESPARTKKH